jgi:hypothetical protein
MVAARWHMDLVKIMVSALHAVRDLKDPHVIPAQLPVLEVHVWSEVKTSA